MSRAVPEWLLGARVAIGMLQAVLPRSHRHRARQGLCEPGERQLRQQRQNQSKYQGLPLAETAGAAGAALGQAEIVAGLDHRHSALDLPIDNSGE